MKPGGDFTNNRLAKLFAAAAAICLLAGCSAADFGPEKEMTVITREDGSGTRDAFVSLFDIRAVDEKGREYDATVMTADTQPSTGVVITSVADNENAIGYISIGALNNEIKPLSIDGAAPTAENVKSGSYKVTRSFNIALREDQSAAGKDFVAFILSAEGQAVVEKTGYISVPSDKTAYAASPAAGVVSVSGSSSVAPVMQALKEAYEKQNKLVHIEVNISDSSTGVADAASGACDIGMSSRELKSSEIEKGLSSTAIALDGIALIVNPQNTIQGLSSAQIRAIYTGAALTWQEVLALDK